MNDSIGPCRESLVTSLGLRAAALEYLNGASGEPPTSIVFMSLGGWLVNIADKRRAVEDLIIRLFAEDVDAIVTQPEPWQELAKLEEEIDGYDDEVRWQAISLRLHADSFWNLCALSYLASTLSNHRIYREEAAEITFHLTTQLGDLFRRRMTRDDQ